MALQSSGTITIQDIVDEFGGTAPHSLSEYYRGGAYVGSNNAGVPTSGTISLSDFYGATAATVVTIQQGNHTADGGVRNYGYCSGWNKVWSPANNAFASNPVLSGTNTRTPNNIYGAIIANISLTTVLKGNTAFVVILEGNYSKNYFTSITPQGGVTLNTAAAGYFVKNNSNPSYAKATIWEWESGSFTMPSGWDGSGSRTAEVV